MKFKLGDFVRFVDEKREGYITRIIDTLLVGVTDTDGFEIPVGINNLTYVHGQSGQSNEIIQVDAKSINSQPLSKLNLTEHGLRLVLVTKDKGGSEYIIYVENSTRNQILYTFHTESKGVLTAEVSGIIPAQTLVPIFEVNMMNLEGWPSFKLQLLYFNVKQPIIKDPLIWSKKFKATDFNIEKQKLALSNQLGFIFPLEAIALKLDPDKLKESFFTQTIATKSIEKPDDEIDLHIESLDSDFEFLNPSEILNIQIQAFEKYLDAAIVNQMPSIIFIHGIGNGTLRHHIHKRLGQHKQVRTFADARKEKFGYGATQVFFK